MQNSRGYFFIVVYSALLALASGCAQRIEIDTPGAIGMQRIARISPNYSGIVIPPNIAPLNFTVKEPGEEYLVKISTENGDGFDVSSSSPQIIIPRENWESLLISNAGSELFIDVYSRGEDDNWRHFETIVNTIAKEPIDQYLVYRLIKPIHGAWRSVGIYQRDLESYTQTEVFHGKSFGSGCLNCHTFANNRTDRMLVSTRSDIYGSAAIVVHDDKVEKIGAKFGYSAWHPSGKMVAYSVNKTHGYFHTAGSQVRDVLDAASALCYYKVDEQEVKTTQAISNRNCMETYPTWSPDGRYLYFCSAPLPRPPDSSENAGYNEIKDVRYNLMRIGYDVEADSWGDLETVLSAEETGMSILLPRISPDGRYLVFCMCDHGTFPIYQPSSDLYLLDLESGQYRKLKVNSDKSESWHSWSSNSRWLVFSSKRREKPHTKIFISYVDNFGNAHSPFVLPQEDPLFYDSFLKAYSVPELVKEPVRISQQKLAEAVLSPRQVDVKLPLSSASPRKVEPVGNIGSYQGSAQ
jgi:WD40 repeat protein